MRIKVRHVVYLEPDQSKKLMARSKKTGALPTEIVRRALREYLKRAK
ncbi:MAG TPA: ribbon-helix-helix domain-containing protein [Candidatus Limnocylindrales bacterium]|nr:ribbon-helix-helix domain-containing protein [Candidatus Limnocylindrales bacterium]